MNTFSPYVFLALALPLGITACCHSPAQPSTRIAPDDALGRLAQLQAELCAARQTNVAIQVSELAAAFMVSEQTDKVQTDAGILRRLRSGNTNIIELLEDDLDTSIVTLTHFELGERQLKALRAAKQYRAKFPRKTDYPETDAQVGRALGLVDDK